MPTLSSFASPRPALAVPRPDLQTQPASLEGWSFPEPAANLILTAAQALPAPVPRFLEPRFGLSFETGPGRGYRASFFSAYGFVPFAPAPERSTFFAEGRFNYFTGAELGGNLRLGYCQQLPNDLVLGGYLGYDVRQTEWNETFWQLGLGFDLQASRWELRLNGYLPLGEQRRELRDQQQLFF